jgi:DNA-directed RNA polymerase specialized sigma24 family protein
LFFTKCLADVVLQRCPTICGDPVPATTRHRGRPAQTLPEDRLAQVPVVRQCTGRQLSCSDGVRFRWVGEADESRADAAFRDYYSTAFPSLARHVQHRTGWDPATAEDIAQEALLRFFRRAGPGRRQAVAVIQSAAMRLTTAPHRAPHPRRTVHWAGDVGTFVSSVTGFRLSSDEQWRTAADEIWSQIVSLQRRGLCLIDEAGVNLRRADENHSPDTPHAAAVAKHHPEVGRLGESVLTVIETLPRLRLPTNGFLFEIATTLFLDEIKRRRRRKRGGVQVRAPAHELAACVMGDAADHPVELVPDEPQGDSGDWSWLDQHPTPEAESLAAASMPSRDLDPVVRYESEEFLHRFYEYLRAPLARATRALEEARGTGLELSERSRLESVSRKFSRMMAVLSLMGEGYTQEEAARRVRLSRNQVKYIVESVKEAYARFAADKPLLPRQRVAREGESHVS